MVEPSSDTRAGTHAPSGLRAYLYLIRRYAWFTLLVTAIAIGATFALTQRQEEIYSASSSVLLRTPQTESLFPLSNTAPRQFTRDPGTEQLFAQGPDFVAQARSEAPDGVSVRVSGDLNNLVFRASGTDPAAAAEAANAFAQAYVQIRHQALIDQTTESLDFIETSIADLQAERSEITEELDILDGLLATITETDQLTRALAQKVSIEATLQPQLAPIDSQISGFTADLADLQLVTRFLDDPSVSARIARTASVPSSPSSPNVQRNLIMGALLGLALGIGLPVLREALRDRVEHQDDVEAVTDLVVLGSIPHYKPDPKELIESIDRPHSLASESYQAALTALEFASIGDTLSSVLITSAAPAEGKTTTAVNLAALASQYMNVLLIDADMRRPNVHETLGVPNDVGLADVLRGKADFLDARFTFAHGDARFDTLTSGPVPKDPTLLLRGNAWAKLLDDLFLYDLVIVDSPPVLAVTDALLLGKSTGGQVLITSAGTTNRSEVAEAAELLGTNGGRSLGVLVNNEPQSRSNYYDYYGSYPSATRESKSKRRLRRDSVAAVSGEPQDAFWDRGDSWAESGDGTFTVGSLTDDLDFDEAAEDSQGNDEGSGGHEADRDHHDDDSDDDFAEEHDETIRAATHDDDPDDDDFDFDDDDFEDDGETLVEAVEADLGDGDGDGETLLEAVEIDDDDGDGDFDDEDAHLAAIEADDEPAEPNAANGDESLDDDDPDSTEDKSLVDERHEKEAPKDDGADDEDHEPVGEIDTDGGGAERDSAEASNGSRAAERRRKSSTATKRRSTKPGKARSGSSNRRPTKR